MKKNLKKLLIGTLLLGCFLVNPISAFADNIPPHVKEKADLKVEENRDTIPNGNARFVDLEGNETEVLSIATKSLLRLPDDGFSYYYDSYQHTTPGYKNWYYENLGTFRATNSTDSEMQISYKQSNSTTSYWSVSGEISGTAKLKVKFIGEVETSLKIAGSTSKSYYAGTEYGSSYPVPAKTAYYLTNYAVGGYGAGEAKYEVRSPSGTLLGYHYEPVGGTILSKNDVHIALTDTEPAP